MEKLVLETITALAKNGFEESDIQSSLNTIEFGLREFNTGSFPRGLSLMLGFVSKWIYDQVSVANSNIVICFLLVLFRCFLVNLFATIAFFLKNILYPMIHFFIA